MKREASNVKREDYIGNKKMRKAVRRKDSWDSEHKKLDLDMAITNSVTNKNGRSNVVTEETFMKLENFFATFKTAVNQKR